MTEISNPVRLDPWHRIVDCHFGVAPVYVVYFQYYWVGSEPAMTQCAVDDPYPDLPFQGSTYSPAFWGTKWALYPTRENYFEGDGTGMTLPEGFTATGLPEFGTIHGVADNSVVMTSRLEAYLDLDLFFGYDSRGTRIIVDQEAKTATYVLRSPNVLGDLWCDGAAGPGDGYLYVPWDSRGWAYEWGDYAEWSEVDDLYNFVACSTTLDFSGFRIFRDGKAYEVDTIIGDEATVPYGGASSVGCTMKRVQT